MFNILAFCVGLYLGWYYQSFIFLIIHFSSITCLWWYSVSLKKKPVIGNLVVSSLTVLVIFLTQKYTAMDSLVGEQIMYLSHDRVFDIPSICIIWIFMGMAFVQMERAAPSLAGAEPLPNTAVAAECFVGKTTIRQKRSLRLRRRWKWLVT